LGAVAIELLSSERRFAAVVLDLHMPRVDGRSVLGHIRRTPNLAALPVIVLTGSCDSSTEVEVIDAGADDYLSKPADPPRFLARVRAVLRRAAALARHDDHAIARRRDRRARPRTRAPAP